MLVCMSQHHGAQACLVQRKGLLMRSEVNSDYSSSVFLEYIKKEKVAIASEGQ